MKNLVLSLAALAAILIAGLALVSPSGPVAAATPTPTPTRRPYVPPPPPLSVALACSPLTTSQLAQPGDIQTCRARVTNQSGGVLNDVVVTHNSRFTLTGATVCFGPSCAGKTEFAGQALTIANNSSALITYTYVRGGPYQDGLARTNACAWAPNVPAGCGIEQKSLP